MDKEEWTEAADARTRNPPGSFYDVKSIGVAVLLYGRIQFWHNADVLFRPSRLAEIAGASESWAPRKDANDQEATDHEGDFLRGRGQELLLFACDCANAIDPEGFLFTPAGAVAWLNTSEGGAPIRLRRTAHAVVIDSHFDPGHELVVPTGEFYEGARAFLGEFVGRIEQRITGLIGWESLAPLHPFIATLSNGLRPSNSDRMRYLTNRPTTPSEPKTDGTVVHDQGAARQIARDAFPSQDDMLVEWIPEQMDWESARRAARMNPSGSYYDREYIAPHDLLISPVRFRNLGHPVEVRLPLLESERRFRAWQESRGESVREIRSNDWVELPLIDLAVRLALIVGGGNRPRTTSMEDSPARYRPSIGVGRSPGGPIIREGFLDELRSALPTALFEESAVRFIRHFVRSVSLYAPELLMWETFAPLRPFDDSSE
ncbi:MAG: hypothetical protein QOJ59_2792 [Thermomicrobiales bacterium]|nr:hypothetical protein [Thermomicrobiales bacterium]